MIAAKELEIALRRVDPSVALPYWDSTLDSTIPNPTESSLFTNELMGRSGPDGSIQTGAFRGWRTVDGCPTPAGWTALEYSHGNPHVFIGGMSSRGSPGDVMLLAIQIRGQNSESDAASRGDLCKLRDVARTRGARETQYPPNNPACSSDAHYGSNTMQPFFPMTNIDGLSNQYTDSSSVTSHMVLHVARPKLQSEEIVADISTQPPTTQPPIMTTTPAGPSQETCFNEQQCCAPWANNGECRNNPAYMNLWCRASCGICRPTTYNLN
ncbi:shTK domain protein, partial [Teladorsagia circumcincta]